MITSLLSLEDIKKEPFFIENILWDVMPKDLTAPTVSMKEGGIERREHLKGYVFYIDGADTKPVLFLMRHTSAGYAETIARIEEIPEDIIAEAVQENKDKAHFMMYPINKKVKEWLLTALTSHD